jgi:hypothetical protein
MKNFLFFIFYFLIYYLTSLARKKIKKMKNEAYNILFEKKFEGSNEKYTGVNNSLFNNRNELVIYFFQNKKQTYFVNPKSVSTVRAEIYGIFRNSPARKITTEFRDALILVLTNRLNEIGYLNSNEIIEEFSNCLDNMNTLSFNQLEDAFPSIRKAINEFPSYKEYYEDLIKAETVVVITRQPAELIESNDSFISAIIEMTTYVICSYFVYDLKTPKFEYYFPSGDDIAKSFWIKLRDILTNKIKSEKFLSDKFNEYRNKEKPDRTTIDIESSISDFLHKYNNDQIKVFEKDNADTFIINHTIFDPNDNFYTKGYFHWTSDSNKITQMSFSDRLYWQKSVWGENNKFRNSAKLINFPIRSGIENRMETNPTVALKL